MRLDEFEIPMRFHLIFILSAAFGMMVARADPAIPEVLYRAPNEAIIEKWAHGRGTGSRIERIKADGKQILVALVDSCFGLTCESIYVFVFEDGEWRLCLLRLNNSPVTVIHSGKALIFKDPDGAVLVEQPIASLTQRSYAREKSAK